MIGGILVRGDKFGLETTVYELTSIKIGLHSSI